MRNTDNKPLVTTVKERCRICYTCVRECPAKAIRIADGQAEIIPQRCIGCGNCVRVCSQKAKQVLDSKQIVFDLLKSDGKTAAMLAPSFPAEFTDIGHKELVGMLHKLGFDHVHEVGFGADLVADRFDKLLAENTSRRRFIATSCPAIVAYIEKYHPDLVGNLAPIVSPMIATARALNQIYGKELNLVFIGPCIAKKGEISSVNLPDDIDAGLTFVELREMFKTAGIADGNFDLCEFDEPLAGTGAIFPISRGLFQTAEISEDLIKGDIVAVEGGNNFVEAFKEFQSGSMDVVLLEALACNGCVMGPGMSSNSPLFKRRANVSSYVRGRMENFDKEKWLGYMKRFENLDLSRAFAPFDQRIEITAEDQIEQILNRMGKFTDDDELNCGACGYNTCREHATAIHKGLAESEMCLPFTIEKLHKTIEDLASSNNQLASTQEALMQSEKLASMGQLAAGIAHEVNNPLGVVMMYAHLLLEKHHDNPQLAEDLKMIAEQSDRCKKIVGGLLNFARKNKVILQPTDIYDLLGRAVRSMSNEKRARIEIVNNFSNKIADVDPDQLYQVLTNLMTNALAAIGEDGKVIIELNGNEDKVRIKVIDNGTGICKEHISKIFDPFFTTKQIGVGTGLGLAVTYGIVKMHKGDIKVESNADKQHGPTGTAFEVVLPRKQSEETEIL